MTTTKDPDANQDKRKCKLEKCAFLYLTNCEPCQYAITQSEIESIDANYRDPNIDRLKQAVEAKRDELMKPTPTLDLQTLKYVKLLFGLCSDYSTRCNGYHTLCNLIENTDEAKGDKPISKMEITEPMAARDIYFALCDEFIEKLGRDKIVELAMQQFASQQVADRDREILKQLQDSNPYLVDVFTKPTEDELKQASKLMSDNGLVPDRIYAYWGRWVWQAAVKELESLLKP